MSLDTQKLELLLTALSNFSGVIKERLDGKLNIVDQAADSAKLDGKTLAEIQTLIGGDISAALSDLEAQFAAFIARTDNPHAVTAEQVGLGLVANYAVASSVEAVAGEATDKYMTPAGSKALLDAFWAEQVGTAPETLDTIQELAAALQNNPDAITALQAIAGDNADAIAALQAQVGDIDLSTKLDVNGNLDQTTVTEGEGEEAVQVPLPQKFGQYDAAIATLRGDMEAADVTINGRIDAEESARQGADAALDLKIDNLDARLEGSKVDKGGNIDDNTVTQGEGEEAEQVALSVLIGQLQAGIAQAGDATALEALQTAFNNFVAAKATGIEVIEGLDDTKYTTALAVKTAIDKAVSDLVGAAPEALDTINELAAALQNNPDVITALQALVQDNADALAALSTTVDGKLDKAAKASSAEVTAGTEDEKYITPAALKPTLDAQALAIDTVNTDLGALMTELAAAFDTAAAAFDPEEPAPGV